MKKILKKIFPFLNSNSKEDGPKKSTWKDIEYFEDSWINRVSTMAELLPENASVMDLGCGTMGLPKIKKISKYIPVDYKKRSEDMLVCDFNKKEFPNESAEFAFVSGCLEYVDDPEWFVSKIAQNCTSCIISYCTVDEIPDLARRTSYCWVNHLSKADVIALFEKQGMMLQKESFYKPSNSIFLFEKTTK